jgi:hypothetical protein
MVRAELGNGNRDHATSLIKRLQERYVFITYGRRRHSRNNTRQYPESIVNRISGIMLDDAVSPWSSAPSSEVNNFTSSGSHSP